MKALCKRIAAIAPTEWGLTFGDGLDNDKNVLWNTDGPVVVYFFADLGDAPANHCSTVRILEWLRAHDPYFEIEVGPAGWTVRGRVKGEIVPDLATAALTALSWWLEAGERV